MRTTTFLMFQGDAEAWLDLAVTAIPGSRITSVTHHGPAGPGAEGSVAMAEAVVGGLTLRCNDSPPVHEFTFTPSTSLFVDLDSEAEHTEAHALLSQDGRVLMPPDDYGFSPLFSWVQDRFGVSWQLNVPVDAAEQAARATRVTANLQVADLDAAKPFYTDFLGLSVEEFNLGWVARLSAADSGASLQLVTQDATAPAVPAISVHVRDVEAAYRTAVELGYEIVHPLTVEEWGVHRFLVRAPDGTVVNLVQHR